MRTETQVCTETQAFNKAAYRQYFETIFTNITYFDNISKLFNMEILQHVSFLTAILLLGIGSFFHIGYITANGFKEFFIDVIINNHYIAWVSIYIPIILLLISGLIELHIQDNNFYSNILFSLTH